MLNVTLPLPKPVFAAEPTAAKQGDLLTVTARNLPDGVTPSGESKLGYVRFVRGADGVWSALVPVGYARDPGDYTITVTAGSETATLPVTVSETAFEAAAEPKELVIIPGATHTDLYDRLDVIPFDKLTSFFTDNLKQTTTEL